VKGYYDRIPIAYIFDEKTTGTVDLLGAYASTIRYIKDGKEVSEILNNEDFVILDEIVFEHFEEEN
jgi:hypothetical protein